MRTRLAAAMMLAAVSAGALAQDRPVPYWASIAAGEATMRTGPDRTYPATWLYRRRDLPVRVLQVHEGWRRVQERDGTSGWMLAVLLAARRTAIVSGGTQPIRDQPEEGAAVLWQAEEGVIGRISHCDGRWCRIQIEARKGYVAQGALWGLDPDERID